MVPVCQYGVLIAVVGLTSFGCGNVARRAPWAQSLAAVEGGSFTDSTGTQRNLAPFAIDATEVTVAEYRDCVKSGVCSEARTTTRSEVFCETRLCKRIMTEGCNYRRVGAGRYPVNCVSFRQAQQFCEWRDGRIPTEWEWEWAARGGSDARLYPWGSADPDCSLVIMTHDRERPSCGYGYTAPTAKVRGGRSAHGLFDLVGNVEEWVVSEDGSQYLTAGGSGLSVISEELRAAEYRQPIDASVRAFAIGFRCAYDVWDPAP